MVFNSIEFLAFFLPAAFFLYWFVFRRWQHAQNAFLVVASYVFYGWWDWRFLGLIFLSSLTDYLVGLGLARQTGRRSRRVLVACSLVVNLGLLGFFKYFDFFAVSFAEAMAVFGWRVDPVTLRVILPVGISFYTFQTLSYTLDVYAGKIPAARDPVAFFAYVSFFPQLVAGPIERATELLPQFLRPRRFDYHEARDGVRQMLWGLFKKVAVADTCGICADEIFGHAGAQPGLVLWVGAVYFAFQIYGDFSGYSDIAIGTARLFGFRLCRNFAFPYFSRDIAEFWRRWHISLTSWFRDYVYIPLGGSRSGRWLTIRNVLVIFLVSGLWHGANWTFLAWGLLHAVYFLPLIVLRRNRRHLDTVAAGRLLPGPGELLRMLGTFGLTVIAWVVFRCRTVVEALAYLKGMFSVHGFFAGEVDADYAFPIALMLAAEWLQRDKQHALQIDRLPVWARWAVYYGLIYMVLYFFGEEKPFIYFQF